MGSKTPLSNKNYRNLKLFLNHSVKGRDCIIETEAWHNEI